jgi:hypothetical protein
MGIFKGLWFKRLPFLVGAVAFGCALPEGEQFVISQCESGPMSCLTKDKLVGKWQCGTDLAGLMEIDEDGTVHNDSNVNADQSQKSLGCVTCDGDYEALSTEDSGTSTPNFSVVNGLLELATDDADVLVTNWDWCTDRDIDACRKAPDGSSGRGECVRAK